MMADDIQIRDLGSGSSPAVGPAPSEGVIEMTPLPAEPISTAVKSYVPLVSYFEMYGRADPVLAGQLQYIWDYVRDTGAKSNGEALKEVSKIESKLSPPKIGETRVGRLYQYVKLMSTVKEAEAWKQRMAA